MDGANVAIFGSGYREAMTGAITLYSSPDIFENSVIISTTS
jgi:hypothetical protein